MIGDRREFLKAAARASRLTFVSCGLARAAPQSAGNVTPKIHTPVVINGRRIRTVDMHAHCAVPAATELLNQQLNPSTLLLDGQSLADRLAYMDVRGIDVAVLSINPNWYNAGRDLASQIIEVQNSALAEFCGTHADRFAAFASVALQFPDLAAAQLERAMKKMGLRGAAIGGSVGGLELADPKFDSFWAKAEELGAVVFIHPQGSAAGEFRDRLRGNGALGVTVCNPI